MTRSWSHETPRSAAVSWTSRRDLGRRQRLERLQHLADDRRGVVGTQVHRQTPPLDAGEVEQVADQAVHAVARALDRLDLAAGPLLLVGRQRALEQERARREHDAERIAQIVRHDREQILARAQRLLGLVVEPHVVDRDRRPAARAPRRRPGRTGGSAASRRPSRARSRRPSCPRGATGTTISDRTPSSASGANSGVGSRSTALTSSDSRSPATSRSDAHLRDGAQGLGIAGQRLLAGPREGEDAHLASPRRERDRAAVGDRADGQLGDRLQHGVQLHRRAQRRARVAQEPLPLLTAALLGHVVK